MIKLAKLFLLVFCCLALTACGGGGGGDESSDSSDDGNQTIAVRPGVRLLHGVIESEPAALALSSNTPNEFIKFGETSSFYKTGNGLQNLNVFRRANALSPAAVEPAETNSDSSYSLLYFGNTQRIGLKANLITNDIPASIPDNGAAVKIVNAAVGPTQTTATVAGAGSISASFGGGSAYLIVPTATITVSATGLFSARTFALAAGKANTILITGEQGVFISAKAFRDN